MHGNTNVFSFYTVLVESIKVGHEMMIPNMTTKVRHIDYYFIVGFDGGALRSS